MSTKLVGIGFSGACAATAYAIWAVAKLLQGMGAKVNCLILEDQGTYLSRATTSWRDIRNAAAFELATRADTAARAEAKLVVFGHSLGGLAAFAAALRYCCVFDKQGESEPDADAAATECTTSLDGKIDTVLLYNPSVSTSAWLWFLKGPAVVLLAICHRIPLFGWLIPLIPVWRVTSSAPGQAASWMPLGMVWTIWRAQAEIRRLTRQIQREQIQLPFQLIAFVGTSDRLCPAAFTAQWVRSIGGKAVALALNGHELDGGFEHEEVERSELLYLTRRVLEGKEPRGHED